MSYYEGITDQPAEVMRFLSAVTVSDSTHSLLKNELDYNVSFISKYYTPNLKVSNLSSIVKQLINESDTDWVNNLNNIDNNSLISLVDNSNLKVQYPSIYNVMQGIILEFFSIGYAQDEDTSLFSYLSDAEISNVLNSIEYVLDALANLSNNSDDQYIELIAQLTTAYSDISNVKTNLKFLKSQYNNPSNTI